MTAATDLWAAVALSYPTSGLIALTNLSDNAAVAVNQTAGELAAQEVLDIWPAYAQCDYDETSALHVAIAKRAVIAQLWVKGGTAANIARLTWDEVFAGEGLIDRLKRTGPRARQGPLSNSGVQMNREDRIAPILGWSDRDSLPGGILPNTRSPRWD